MLFLLEQFLLRILRPVLERLFWYPRVIEFKAEESAVLVKREDGGTACQLVFGRHPSQDPGMFFIAKVRLPSMRASGKLQLVQDVAIMRKRTPAIRNPGSTFECRTSNGAYMLDETDPYEELQVQGFGPHQIITSDSPSSDLFPSERYEVDDRYRMFLMWTPDRYFGLVRLSVARIEWWWKGRAEADGQNPDCQEGQRGWKLVSSPDDHDHTPSQATLRRPVTSPNITTVKQGPWIPC